MIPWSKKHQCKSSNLCRYMGVSKNNGTPKSSILIGFSIINHPFWGTPIFGNTHILPFVSFQVSSYSIFVPTTFATTKTCVSHSKSNGCWYLQTKMVRFGKSFFYLLPPSPWLPPSPAGGLVGTWLKSHFWSNPRPSFGRRKPRQFGSRCQTQRYPKGCDTETSLVFNLISWRFTIG